MAKMTDEHKAAMLAGRVAHKLDSFVSSNEGIDHFQAEALERVRKYLPSAQNAFVKAFSGKSKALAIKAKCIECCNLQKVEVAGCLVKGCPLYRYRPYRGGK